MAVLLKNNAVSRLASSLTAGATTLSITAGEGARFPAPSGGDWFPITVIKASGALEVMRCTARSGDVLTVTRAQEGTAAQAFSAGDRVELRLTKAVIDDINTQLSDMQTDLNTTINNLGLVGSVTAFARSTAPAGWLKANGAAVSRTTYAALFAAIGTTFGVGDGSTTFNLPDLRGEFLRGWDDARGIDSGRAFGTLQTDDLKSHTHTASTGADAHTHTLSTTTSSAGSHGHDVLGTGARGSVVYLGDSIAIGVCGIAGGGAKYLTDPGGSTTNLIEGAGAHTHTVSGTTSSDSHTHTVTVNATGGTETRPRNRALLFCIKY